MSDPRDTSMMPMCNRDLVPVKRIGISRDPLIVGHLHTVMSHTRVIIAGSGGASRRKHRQHRDNNGDNHPFDTHDGLPDIGPKMVDGVIDNSWERNAKRMKTHSRCALGIQVT